MAVAQGPKGNKVKLSTFNSWGKQSILGFKTVESDGVSHVNFIWCKVCAKHLYTMGTKLKTLSESLIAILKRLFQDFSNSVFSSMQWLDPQYWTPAIDYGNEKILSLCAHFKFPLEEAGFDASKVENEWRQLRKFISSHYLKPDDDFTAAVIWQNILRYRRNEYSNICKIVSLIISMSGSNSTVERAFSVLSLILSDRRLSLPHRVLNHIMLIKANDKNWSQEEKVEIIERALSIYLSKRRVKQIDDTIEPPTKIRRTEESGEMIYSSDEELEDDFMSSVSSTDKELDD